MCLLSESLFYLWTQLFSWIFLLHRNNFLHNKLLNTFFQSCLFVYILSRILWSVLLIMWRSQYTQYHNLFTYVSDSITSIFESTADLSCASISGCLSGSASTVWNSATGSVYSFYLLFLLGNFSSSSLFLFGFSLTSPLISSCGISSIS